MGTGYAVGDLQDTNVEGTEALADVLWSLRSPSVSENCLLQTLYSRLQKAPNQQPKECRS